VSSKITFVGAGSWGTAVASLVANNRHEDTILWARRAELAETINLYHESPEYLPDIALPEQLRATSDLEEALDGAETIVMAVPSHGFREVLRGVSSRARPGACFVSLTKGLEVDTRKRMSEVLSQEVPGIDESRIAVLTGPNLAKEIVQGYPAASTIACKDAVASKRLQETFHVGAFRCYTNNDVVGCEIGGAFKNVIAIAAGIADGLGFGDNTRATVMTRGLAEMARFSVRFGAHPLTFLGLAGVGDLIATCTSMQSRNHSVGTRLGRGETITDILASMHMVAEGVKSCKPIFELGQEAGVRMPITHVVVKVCHEELKVEDVVMELLEQDIQNEFAGVEEYLMHLPEGNGC
jgi:glycerol-3-phosphate dehydrogenase (NAD(P)+)